MFGKDRLAFRRILENLWKCLESGVVTATSVNFAVISHEKSLLQLIKCYLIVLVYLQLLPQQTHLNFLQGNNSHYKDFLEFHGVCSHKDES